MENHSIVEEKLITWLAKQIYAKVISTRAVEELCKATTNLQDDLYSANYYYYRIGEYGA